MKRIKCSTSKSDPIADKITGEYILYPKNYEIPLYGRQMPNGRLFVPYIGFVEMYEPGEYKFVCPFPRPEDKED